MTPLVVLAVSAAEADHNADAAVLASALSALGVRCSTRIWDDPSEDWADAAVVHLHAPWNYTSAVDSFRSWLTAVEPKLFQPRAIIDANLSKTYLLRLGGTGLRAAEGVFVVDGDFARCDLGSHGRGPVVCKPCIGAGGRGAVLYVNVEEAAAAPRQLGVDLLVQRFVPEIADGEISVVVIDGQITHSVLKKPAAGEFRVQDHFGGTVETTQVDPSLADAVALAIPSDARYARLDAVATSAGPLVMEIEMIEPDLFLRLNPAAAARLARSLARAACA